jgi:hypothetical protein
MLAALEELTPAPVAKVTPWSDGTIAAVTVLAALVGELTCA